MENNLPFFSIIIPTYNRSNTIRRPIESILAQTYKDWELIIVDDGSTDGTKEIIDGYNDPRIRYVWQENQERSVARNHGIDLVKGEWICFQDSDDEYLPRHLQVLYEAILQNQDYKVIRTALLINYNRKIISKKTDKHSVYDPYPFESLQCFTFHTSVIKQNYRFENGFTTIEDFEFLLQVGRQYQFLQISDWTVVYSYNPKSSGGIGPNYEKHLIHQIYCLDSILKWNDSMILPYIIRKRCIKEMLMLFGHMKFKRRLIFNAIFDNIQIFYRFPKEYAKLSFRIILVKIGELFGITYQNYRF